jgi:glycosyltransferase involved in cell wall biosynthesis
MMLSICIPTYNCDVNDLVAELSRQCTDAKVDFEIIVLEDGSDEDYAKQNSCIEKIHGAQHIVNVQNQGRSYTRNKLADIAKGEKLIFIDCDSAIPDQLFINRYLDNSSIDVVCGGTTYTELQYSPEISLRYTFGTKVEKSTADKRNQAPYSAFTTNNMMVSKTVFEKIRFCEALKKYGHEDSLFGFDLQENKIPIHHIDNPVIHTGIESNDKFLAKTRAGIENLVDMKHIDGVNPKFFNHIRLCRHYAKLKKIHLLWTIRLTFKIFGKSIERHLLSSNRQKLMLFNLYKLGYLSKMEKAR